MEHQGFRPIVSPDVPVRVRRALTGAGVWHSLASDPRSGPREWHPAKAIGVVLSVAIGAGGVLGGLLALMIWATSAHTRDPAPAAALWSLGLGPAVLAALVSIPALWLMIRNWRTERLALRWWGYGIPAARQAAAAAADPGTGARLVALAELVGRLRAHRAVRESWLPGIDDGTLGRLHFRLATGLLGTVDLRAAVAEAADRPVFAPQVAARREELAEADAAFDAELAHLRSIAGTADEIVQVLDDLALAERLGSGAPTAQQLREQFTAAPTDLAAMAAAAREAAALVRQALDPNRLYAADRLRSVER